MSMMIPAVVLMLLSAAFNAVGAVFFKLASSRMRMDLKAILENRPLIYGLGAYVLSTVVALPAFRFAEITLLYPLISTAYIWACLLSEKYVGERMTWVRWVGIAAIILGVSLIGIGSA